MLGKGFFADLKNFRFRDGVLTVRSGAAKLTSTLISGSSFRGAWAGYLNGSLTVVAAYREGATTRVYTYDPSTWARTERTSLAGAAPYNGTRFAADAWLSFAPVRMRTTTGFYDLLAMSNGTDDPAVLNLEASGIHAPPALAGTVLPHKALSPIEGSASAAYFGPDQWLNLAATLGKVYTNSSALTFALANSGATPNSALQMTVDSTVTGSPTAIFEWSASDAFSLDGAGYAARAFLDLSTARQLILSVKDNIASPVWERVKIEAWSAVSSAYITLWDQSGTSLHPVYIESEPEITRTRLGIFGAVVRSEVGTYLVAFDLGHLASQAANLAQVTRLRFTYTGAAPAVDTTVDIRALMVSGLVPGGSDYTASLYDAPTRAESAGVVIPNAQGPALSTIGAGSNVAGRLPISPALYYSVRLGLKLPSSTGQAGYVKLYRRGLTEGEYAFVGYSSAYAIPSPTIIAGLSFYLENVGDEDRDPDHLAPSALHLTLPKARTLHAQNGRLYAGGIAGALSDVYASEQNEAFRFLSAARFSVYEQGVRSWTCPRRRGSRSKARR